MSVARHRRPPDLEARPVLRLRRQDPAYDQRERRWRHLDVAASDMSKAFLAGLRARAPHVDVAFDRFHVEELVHDASDELRSGLVVPDGVPPRPWRRIPR